MSADQVRLPGRDLDLDALFLFEAKRRVQRDRTVSLNGALFEAHAALIGRAMMPAVWVVPEVLLKKNAFGNEGVLRVALLRRAYRSVRREAASGSFRRLRRLLNLSVRPERSAPPKYRTDDGKIEFPFEAVKVGFLRQAA